MTDHDDRDPRRLDGDDEWFTTEQYRGFDIGHESGDWFAIAGGGKIRLGPFKGPGAARLAVDVELD